MARFGDLRPPEPAQRYGEAAPGSLLHIDTKTPGRFDRTGHRVNGNLRGGYHDGVGWDMLFVVINDHARIARTQVHPDGKSAKLWPSCARRSPTTACLASPTSAC